MKLYSVRLLFEPRDCWVGLYWTRRQQGCLWDGLDIFVCLIPMLPLRLRFVR